MNSTRLPLIAAALVAITASISHSADIPPGATLVKQITWTQQSLPPGGSIQPGADGKTETLSISHPESAPASIPLWASKEPGVQTKCYAIRGQIRYKDVKGTGYLEMWSEFPSPGADAPGGKYFTRTLAVQGPMSKIEGSSEWRAFLLPFDATQAKTPPSALNVNLVLAGSGTVDFSNVELLQFADSGAMWASMGSGGVSNVGSSNTWWRNSTILSVILGGLILATALAISVVRRQKLESRRMRAMDLQ